jgi:hypothetical protein
VRMSTSVVASAFGCSRRPRSCSGTESNSAGRRGDSAGLGRQNRLPCSEWSVALFFLHITFATRKPLNQLASANTSKVLISATPRATDCVSHVSNTSE